VSQIFLRGATTSKNDQKRQNKTMSEARRDDMKKKLPPLYDERIEAG
jgi:hypothetical protein